MQTVWRTHARAVTIVYAVAHVYCAGGRAERNGTRQLVVYLCMRIAYLCCSSAADNTWVNCPDRVYGNWYNYYVEM